MQLIPFALLALCADGEGGVTDGGGGLLRFEDAVNFELRPHEVAAFGFVGESPPEPALDECFEHERVVAAAHVRPVAHLLWLRPHEESTCEVSLPQKIQVSKHSLPLLFLSPLFLAQSAHKWLFPPEQETVHYIVLCWQSRNGSSVEAVDALPPLLFEKLSLRQLLSRRLSVCLAKLHLPLCLREDDLLLAKGSFLTFLLIVLPHGHQLLPDALNGDCIILQPLQPHLLPCQLTLQLSLLTPPCPFRPFLVDLNRSFFAFERDTV
jgi:hypothetical protein